MYNTLIDDNRQKALSQVLREEPEQQKPSMPNFGTMNNIQSMFGAGAPSSMTLGQSQAGYGPAYGFGGGESGASSLGPIALYAALIGAGKTIEHNNPDSAYGRGLLSGLGPSINQIKADPKLGLFALAGVPFLGGIFRNEEAANVEPEWLGLLKG